MSLLSDINSDSDSGPAEPQGLPASMMSADPALTDPEDSGLADLSDASGEGVKKSLPTNIIMMTMVVAVAAGSLYLMRTVGVRGGVAFTTPKIDYPVDGEGVVDDEAHQRVMEALRTSDDIVQVPLADLQRNPFLLDDSEEIPEIAEAPTYDLDAELRRKAEQRKLEISRTLESLEVNSIISGHVPIARINGVPVRIGDTIAIFTVRAIHGRSVELEADGKLYSKVLGD